jgi:hypothetical protein
MRANQIEAKELLKLIQGLIQLIHGLIRELIQVWN